MPVRHAYKPVWYQNVCDWILSHEGLAPWVDDITTTASSPPLEPENTLQEDIQKPRDDGLSTDLSRRSKLLSRNLRVIDLAGPLPDNSVFVDSFITSLRERRHRIGDVFISLGHYQPQPLPLSKTQLLACLCRQLLEACPEIWSAALPNTETQKAIRSYNTRWKETTLLAMLTSFLLNIQSARVFIIILQPTEPDLALPFTQLLMDLQTLAQTTEFEPQILFIRPSTSAPSKSSIFDSTTAPDTGDVNNEISTMQLIPKSVEAVCLHIDMSPSNPGVKEARCKDHQSHVARLNLGRTQPLDAESLDELLDRYPYDLQLPVHLFSLGARYRSLSPELTKKLILRASLDLVDTVISSLPPLMTELVTACLFWMTQALRPLTVMELLAALRLDVDDCGELDSEILDQLEEVLLCGLIEVEGNMVYASSCLLAEAVCRDGHFRPHTQGWQKAAEQFEPTNERSIALRCYDCISQHYRLHRLVKHPSDNDVSSIKDDQAVSPERTAESRHLSMTGAEEDTSHPSPERPGGERTSKSDKQTSGPLIQYAVDYVFAHLQKSKQLKEQAVMLEHIHRYCIRLHGRFRGGSFSKSSRLGSIPNLSRIQKHLQVDLEQSVTLAMDAAGINGISQTGEWSSMALAACQLGNVDAVKQLDDLGNFIDELVLQEAFDTGSDESLCVLAERHDSFVQTHILKILQSAAMLGNLRLTEQVVNESQHWLQDEKPDEKPLLIYFAAADTRPLPDNLWEMQKKYISHAEPTLENRNALHMAAKCGNVQLVAKMLHELGESPDGMTEVLNHVDSHGATPLHLAVQHAQPAVVEQLLAAGADHSIANNEGQDPLHAASRDGREEIVNALISHGASVTSLDDKQMTAVHWALARKHHAIAQLLVAELSTILEYHPAISDHDPAPRAQLALTTDLDETSPRVAIFKKQESLAGARPVSADSSRVVFRHGPISIAVSSSRVTVQIVRLKGDIDIHVKNDFQSSLINLATFANDIQSVKKLVKYGPDVEQEDANSRSALDHATGCGFVEVLQELLEVEGLERTNWGYSMSPLWFAARSGHTAAVQVILDEGYGCNSEEDSTDPAFAVASYWGQMHVVKLLIPYCNQLTLNKGLTNACKGGENDIAELLLNCGADVNYKTAKGINTALHLAAYGFNDVLLPHLLLRRPDLNPRDDNGRTPLHDSSSRNSFNCLSLLVQAGADLEVEDNDGLTPLALACQGGNHESVRVLLAAKASMTVPKSESEQHSSFASWALMTFDTDVFTAVVEHLAETSSLDVFHEHLLAYIHMESSKPWDKIRVLLDHGMRPNQSIGKYNTMLHYAALLGLTALVELLCCYDSVDLNAIQVIHGTPLQICTIVCTHESLGIIEVLLRHGADVFMGTGPFGHPLCTAAQMPGRQTSDYEEILLNIAQKILDHDRTIVNHAPGFRPNPVQCAVSGRSMKMLELIMRYEPDLTVLSGPMGTPLHVAATDQSVEMAQVLMLSSPFLTLHTRDTAGRLPLHLAALGRMKWSASDMTGLTWFSGKEIPMLSTDSFQGINILHLLASRGDAVAIKSLMAPYPAAIDIKDLDGWTPLHWACRNAKPDAAKLLIDLGADKNERTAGGWTPYDVAVHHGRRLLDDESNDLGLSPPESGENTSNAARDVGADVREDLPATKGVVVSNEASSSYFCDVCECVSASRIIQRP